MNNILDQIFHLVWGLPLLFLIIFVGIMYSILLRGIQVRLLLEALCLAFSNGQKRDSISQKGDISHFEALMTALAATMGIGNIAGVATALTAGGLGSIFWMWVTAFLGMAVKFAEACLALKYRSIDKNGEVCGGPMYFIRDGLQIKWLASAFAFFGVMASFGGGNMIQAHSVTHVMSTVFNCPKYITVFILVATAAVTLLGGIKSISKVASIVVPFMALFYALGAVIVILYFWETIPSVVLAIFSGAFTPQAASGGFLGATVSQAVQSGVSRGLMTSEAGLGTASIAASAAKTESTVDQALISMSGAFLATIIMCTITALAIGATQVLGSTYSDGQVVKGVELTVLAFQKVFPNIGGYIVSIALILFAFTTLIGWAYYGEKCFEYLVGEQRIILFRCSFILFIFLGGILTLETVWKISDICNGLMAIPNLIGLIFLAPVVYQEVKRERPLFFHFIQMNR